MSMKVLVVGGGGREHSLVRACLKSPLASAVEAAPGNGGMQAEVPCHPVKAEDIEGILKLVQENEFNFVIVGPEVPLAMGLVDKLEAIGVPAYGPKEEAAQLEGSKAFCKEFLLRHKIPTAACHTVSTVEEALEVIDARGDQYPVVLKASGLAAGKGVIIADNRQRAEETAKAILVDKVFGESGNSLLIEDFMEGEEASITVIVSGSKYVMLPASQDHKRSGEGDTGLNTGGMGAYCPADCVSEEIEQLVIQGIVEPTLKGLIEEGIEYRGTLYIGIMINEEGPHVVEYNVRFGDPETQVLLPMIETDPLELMHAAATGALEPAEIKLREGYSMVVVVAADGYPGVYPKGDVISLPEACPEDSAVIHAGTKVNAEGEIVTSGGRVLGLVGHGASLREAADKAYALAEEATFKGAYLRRDIGHRQLAREAGDGGDGETDSEAEPVEEEASEDA